jgi:hypothetical protein
VLATLVATRSALAQAAPQPARKSSDAPAESNAAAIDPSIEISPTPPKPSVGLSIQPGDRTQGEEGEAPPVRPRHQGVVLATNLGMLGFAGQFRHVAPPAYWIDGQLGFEALRWLMVFVEGEVAFTDTSESQDESHTIGVPMWGLGGGVRGTFHATERVAFYLQGAVGIFTALVPRGALTVLGFRDAENLNPQLGSRLGVEWYQVDRHYALTANVGGRLAEGFSRILSPGDTPLMWDASVGLRYTF